MKHVFAVCLPHYTSVLCATSPPPYNPHPKTLQRTFSTKLLGPHTYRVTRLRRVACVPARAAQLLNPRLNGRERQARRDRERKETYLFLIHALRLFCISLLYIKYKDLSLNFRILFDCQRKENTGPAETGV